MNDQMVWEMVLPHPAAMAISGARGSGKSCLAYYLAELLAARHGLQVEVLGLAPYKQTLLPEGYKIIESLTQVGRDRVLVIDEVALQFHARRSMSNENIAMDQLLTISRQRNQTVILATHNLHEAETLADRILILNNGKIVALDTAKSLKQRIGNEIGFISLDPVIFTIWPDLNSRIKNELMELSYVDYVTIDDGTIRVFGDMCNHLPELIDICREYGEVTKVDLWETSLEDVFLQLMKAS